MAVDFQEERYSSTNSEKDDLKVQGGLAQQLFFQCLFYLITEVLETIADFDDPNIDRDEAMVGVLGKPCL